jgi:hypothetical protein
MDTYAELEIGLRRRGDGTYAVELRYTAPESDAEVRPAQGRLALSPAELAAWRAPPADPEAYGQTLSARLFQDPEVRTAFAQARSAADGLDVPLRVRLFVGAEAPALHHLHWETLRDPQGHPLLMGENVVFSRYLSSSDWRPVHMRRLDDLRALVAVANPDDVDGRLPSRIDRAGELARARASLGDMTIETLPRDDAPAEPVTLRRMLDHLRDGVDVFYLVCHGALDDGRPTLWLEDEDGLAHEIDGERLVTGLHELRRRPQLVVLASCQSAGDPATDGHSVDQGALAALGPRLAERGIPAVVAMQDDVTTRTVATLMSTFFTELQRDGQIDRAMAVARGAVRDRPDWWVPALFMRLRSGRLWYTPGFADEPQGLRKWPALLGHLMDEHCMPLLGPGVSEHLLGPLPHLARGLAEAYRFPLAPHDREALPPVAQYLAVDQDARSLRRRVIRHLCETVQARHGDGLPQDLRELDRRASLSTIVDTLNRALHAAWEQRQADDPAEPYRLLAGLPIPIYICADPTSLLRTALERAGKAPQVELCRWNRYTLDQPELADFHPSVATPLIYHVFGSLEAPESLVLTEDDYLDYLISRTRNWDLILPSVRRALADRALVFLGFRANTWSFRVLFRTIINQQSEIWKDYANVAVQIEPEEAHAMAPARARRYFETYFQQSKINVYWGNVLDFSQALHRHWEEDEL